MTTGDVWSEPGAAKTFVSIAGQIASGGDPSAALRSLIPVAHRSWWTRPRATTRRYIVEAAQSLGLANGEPSLLAVMALADPEVTFVSHRTIGSHLYHIYPKLGITARTQIRDALKTAATEYQSLD